MPTLVTISPLTAPMSYAEQQADQQRKADVHLAVLHQQHDDDRRRGAKTAPTDRSNSPAVRSSVMPSAMMPSSGRKAIMLETLSGDRKFAVGDARKPRARR